MPVDLQRYDAVLHEVYAAACDPERWPHALRCIAELWHAPRALLYAFSLPSGAVGFSFSHNIAPRELAIYAARGAREDPFVLAGQHKGLLVQGAALLGHDLVARDALVKTPFYRDIWQPLDIGQLCAGIVFDGTDSVTAPTALSLYRPLHDRPFDARDQDAMRRLVAHLSRALGVMFHLRERALTAAALAAAMDGLPHAVMRLDERQRIVYRNAAATRLLGRGDPLREARASGDASTSGRLVLADRLGRSGRLRDGLARLLAQACTDSGAGDVAHFSHALVLPAEDGAPSCVLHAAPAPPVAAAPGSAPAAMVIVHDLAAAAQLAPELLCGLFDLTAAEARAALQLLAGGTVTRMAARLGVSPNTFKSQLQAAYGKTMTHRQTDLLKLLLALSRR